VGESKARRPPKTGTYPKRGTSEAGVGRCRRAGSRRLTPPTRGKRSAAPPTRGKKSAA